MSSVLLVVLIFVTLKRPPVIVAGRAVLIIAWLDGLWTVGVPKVVEGNAEEDETSVALALFVISLIPELAVMAVAPEVGAGTLSGMAVAGGKETV